MIAKIWTIKKNSLFEPVKGPHKLCYSFLVMRVVEAPVVDIESFPNHNFVITVKEDELHDRCVPGQFVMAAASIPDGLPHPLLKRALAIYKFGEGIGGAGTTSFLLKVVGEGTRLLSTMKPGERMSLIGPLGNGFDLTKAARRISFLVVGGTGIASVYLLAEHLVRYGEEVHLVYGGRTEKDLVGLADFKRLGLPILVATEDGSKGYHGLVTDGFKDYLNRFPVDKTNIYTCGPNPMMQVISKFAQFHSIPCQISVESKMGCGFGVCLGCTVMTRKSHKLACTDGPVFDAYEFVWEGSVELATPG